MEWAALFVVPAAAHLALICTYGCEIWFAPTVFLSFDNYFYQCGGLLNYQKRNLQRTIERKKKKKVKKNE